MAGFANYLVTKGGALTIGSIHSPGYVAGSAGWTVNKDGSAEFNNGTFRGHIVGGDLFLYSGVPALGNPPIVWISQATHDPYGNALPFQGIVSQDATGYMGMSGSQLSWQNGAFISGSATGELVVGGTSGVNAVRMLLPFSTFLLAVQPGTSFTAESWHAMSLLNSWLDTGTGEYARYRLLPDGTVQVQFFIHGGTITNGTAVWDAPAGYVPSGAAGVQYFPAVVVSGASAAQADTPQFQLSTAGVLTIEFIASGTTKIAGNLIYSLT